MVTYSSLKDVEKPSLGVSCSSFEWHVSIIDSFPFISPQVETEKHPEMMPPQNWTESRKRVWTPDHDGHLCNVHGVEDRLVPRLPFCTRRRRQVGQAATGRRIHLGSTLFFSFLYTDRGWLLWYRLVIDRPDRISFFHGPLSLLPSHACCICRPWMCWVPSTSYCLLFSASYATKSLSWSRH